jgi:hypothetical protein
MSFATFTPPRPLTMFPSNHPYRAAIDFCAKIISFWGSSDTAFMPDANPTPGPAAVIWCRTLHIMMNNTAIPM